MDDEVVRRRREDARRRVYRRRRLVAAGVAGLIALLLVAGGMLSDSAAGTTTTEASAEPRRASFRAGAARSCRTTASWRSTEPRRTRARHPGHRLPARGARSLERQAEPYARPRRPVLPAFELIAAIVTSEPGDGGDHSMRQEPSTIRRYLRVARAHRMLLLLDIQPGYAPFLQEAKALERWLKEPDVGAGAGPRVEHGPAAAARPGDRLDRRGDVNEVSRYLSGIVRRHDLPQKLLVVHRFTGDMIQTEHDLERHPGVALVVNVDGFGDQPNKISKYNEFTHDLQRRFNGFKLFYEEDLNLMKPKQVLRLRPQPDLVVYE